MTERAFSVAGGRRTGAAMTEMARLRAEIADQLDEVELSTYQFPVESGQRAAELKRAAVETDDEHLQLRALLVQADVQLREGQSVAAGRLLRSVHRWAVEHEDQYLLDRSHRLLGMLFGSLCDYFAFL